MNRLDLTLKQPHNLVCRKQTDPLEPREKIDDPMSQIVAIVCKDAIVMAAESQYTTGNSKTQNARKISGFSFKNGQGLIGECGVASYSKKAVRYIKEQAQKIEVTDEFTISNIVEGVIKRLRLEILETFQKRNYSHSEQLDILKDKNFGLMVAHYHKPFPKPPNAKMPPLVPVLFTISLNEVNPEFEHPFSTIGSAATLAEFILKQFKIENLNWNEAACMAIDTIERIKQENIYCGGPTQFGTVFETRFQAQTAMVYDDNWVNNIVRKLNPYRKKNDARNKRQFNLVIKTLQSEFVKSMRLLQKTELERENQLRAWAAENHPVTGVIGKSIIQEIKTDEKV